MSLSETGGSGSALLLRLFESTFFDVHLAIGYLKTYPNSIGITHYLINRLRSFEYEDVEFYWPQLCYLVITRPTDSVALENFILERSEEDAHIAVITLWYLQASLSDLASTPNSDQFAVCRRILNRVQSIIFTDPPLPPPSDSVQTPSSAYPASSSHSKSSPTILRSTSSHSGGAKQPSPSSSQSPPSPPTRQQQQKINAPMSSLVGMGLLAAAFAMPRVVTSAGRMVIEQGRRIEQPSRLDPTEDDLEDDVPRDDDNEDDERVGRRGGAGSKHKNKDVDSGSEEDKVVVAGGGTRTPPTSRVKGAAATSPRISRRSSAQPNYLPGARIEPSPAIPFATTTTTPTKSSSSFFPNPFSMSSKPFTKPGALGRAKSLKAPLTSRKINGGNVPSISSPSLPMTSHSATNLVASSPSLASTLSSSHHLTGSTLPGYGLPRQFLSHLLLLQACRSQLDLVRSLQDISTRLVLVPKPARVSSLRAELTVLNHGLPRGCSLGMSTRPTPTSPPTLATTTTTPKPSISVTASSSRGESTSTIEALAPVPRPSRPRRKQARVVRISPGESVVLNSADRAPFVVYVEVLEEDLDFDPDRRTNWEDLRRALRERDGLLSLSTTTVAGQQYGQSNKNGRASVDSGLDGYGRGGGGSRSNLTTSLQSRATPSPTPTPTSTTPSFERAEFALGGVANNGQPSSGGADVSSTTSAAAAAQPPPPPIEPEGEMDLVEQLYGDMSLRDESFSIDGAAAGGSRRGEEEEEEIKNRDADELAWSRKEQDKAATTRRERRSSTVSSAASVGSTGRPSIHRKSLNLDRPSTTTTTATKSSPSSSSRVVSNSTATTTNGGGGGTTRKTMTAARPGGRSVQARQAISLDDYAERMRMAAIMLAQLDASQTAARGVVQAGTAAAGTLVGLPVATVAGVGGLVGAGLGAGLGAVKARLGGGGAGGGGGSGSRREPVNGVGQAASGTKASLDTASAAEGTSAVAGAPPLSAATAALSQSAATVEGSTPPTTALNSSHPPANRSASATAVATTTTTTTTTPSAASAAPTQRARVLAPQDAAAIRERIMSEMMALEEERMERMRGSVQARKGWSRTSGLGGTTDNAVVMRAVNKDDPSGAVFAESFEAKSARIRAASPFGHLAHWSLISCIVKTGADLRQEQLAVQLISEFGRIWKEENCPAWIYYFRILVTSENSGLIETITDSVSIHSIKKDAYARVAEDGTQAFASFTLADYFTDTFGSPTSAKYRKAQNAFIESLAAYSVICYLLQLKDRHNGNILVDRAGHLIHIDFGFMLSNSPGSLGFEMAPFKLPQDYIDILGGFDSPEFAKFKELFKRCFRDVRKHAERIITLVELMQKDSNLPCFANGDLTSQQLRERFVLSLTQAQVEEYAEKLILNSATSSFTKLYDLFQGYSNGIL